MRVLVGFVLGLVVGWFLTRLSDQQQERATLEDLRSEAIRLRHQAATTPRSHEQAPVPRPGTQDDLTRIRGIGPVFQSRLNEAGIATFALLAQTPPDRVRAILNAPTWQRIEPERWVAEAAKLASERGT